MMPVEIRLPELSGGSTESQLRSIQSYLFTLAQQLQIAFDDVSQQQAEAWTQQKVGNTTEEKAANFASIKALILKSAALTEHFQQEVERSLRGRYVAQSQFGTYQEETEQRISANSQSIQQKFTDLQRLESAVAGLEQAITEVNAVIRTGLLEQTQDGFGIYGVEIGQQEWENGVIRFRKYTRLTADRLSFYDSNDEEVAYISDRRLWITDASAARICAGSLTAQRLLRLGDYVLEQGADGHLSIR